MTEIPDTIERDGLTFERISGPWSNAEITAMIADIKRFERSGIKCVTQIHNDEAWVYRDKKGWLSPDISRKINNCKR